MPSSRTALAAAIFAVSAIPADRLAHATVDRSVVCTAIGAVLHCAPRASQEAPPVAKARPAPTEARQRKAAAALFLLAQRKQILH